MPSMSLKRKTYKFKFEGSGYAKACFVAPLSGRSLNNSKLLYTAALGIAPYTFRKSFPNGVAATLDTIKMMGFTEIEGGGGRTMSPEEFKKVMNAESAYRELANLRTTRKRSGFDTLDLEHFEF